MFTPEMLASVKKVEATRQERLGMEPRRMTAEEKDALLKAYHPDYREDGFDTIKITIPRFSITSTHSAAATSLPARNCCAALLWKLRTPSSG